MSISVPFIVAITSQASWYLVKYVILWLIAVRVKKHMVRVKARNETVRDRLAVRRAFFWAFRAFPASSPSMPNIIARAGERFFLFSCSSPVFLMALMGVILLIFLAGIHAEIHTVTMVITKERTRIKGWNPHPMGIRPATSSSIQFTPFTSPALIAMPIMFPATMGRLHSTAASCSRQARIWPGAAPTLDRIPN